eukprot:767954-Hanusia_phi.AAC.3
MILSLVLGDLHSLSTFSCGVHLPFQSTVFYRVFSPSSCFTPPLLLWLWSSHLSDVKLDEIVSSPVVAGSLFTCEPFITQRSTSRCRLSKASMAARTSTTGGSMAWRCWFAGPDAMVAVRQRMLTAAIRGRREDYKRSWR